MDELILVALAGFCASFVDGALGMGFGATSSTLLLGAGLSPQAASTTVNLAKVVTGLAAGISHWRFKNIDKKLVLKLGLAGSIGAITGVALLSVVSGAALKPALAGLLSLIGLRILFRFSKTSTSVKVDSEPAEGEPAPKAGSVIQPSGAPLVGFAGGVTNGLIGAWGPVVTPFLLHRGVAPRYAIGTANTSEVAVAAVSSVVLISTIGQGTFDWRIVVAMLVGGVVAAPVSAWVIRYIPARPMGIATAAVLLLTNARELIAWAGVGSARLAVYGGLLALVGLAVLGPKLRAEFGRRPAVEPGT
jgi:uncharacterized protein